MNRNRPAGSRMLTGHYAQGTPRIFGRALHSLRGVNHRLPQPNYNDECNLEDIGNQRNSYPRRRSEITNYAENGMGKPFWGAPQTSDRRGRNVRSNSHRVNSYSRNDRKGHIPKNKLNYTTFYHHSSGNPSQITSSAYTSHKWSPSDSYSSNEQSTHSISNDQEVSRNLSAQSTQSVDTAERSFVDDSLELSNKTVPSYPQVGSDPVAEVISSSHTKLHKDISGFQDNISGYRSQEDASVNGSSCNKSCENDVSFVSHFGSYGSDESLQDGFIPPPTAPSNFTRDESCSNAVAFDGNSSYDEENENITAFVSASDVEDSNKETGVTPGTTNSASSCDSVQPTIPSEHQRICHFNSRSLSITATFPVEDSSSDECEEASDEASSVHGSMTTMDMVPEQIEAINKLLDSVESDRTSVESYEIWEEVKEKLLTVVKKCIRGCWFEPFGSYVSRFAIGTSDMNFALIPNNHINSSHKMLREMVRPIRKEIPDCEPVCDGIQDYRKATVTFHEPRNNISCKIRILGNQNLCDTAKLLCHYGQLDKRVKPLVITVRHWADVCEIHEEENGRLHPLGYILMMIHFLQQCDPPVLPVFDPKSQQKMKEVESLHDNNQEVGYLWVAFLKYYSETFNWKDNVVSIISKDPVLKASKTWGKCWIAIEEPYDEAMNVAKSVVSQDVSNYIQMVFQKSYKYFLCPTSSDELDAYSDETDDTNGNEPSAESSEEDQPKFNYDFYQKNFLNGLCVPIVCSECEHIGHLCDLCLYDESSMLHSLPKMTPELLLVIDDALKQMYENDCLGKMQFKDRVDLVERLERHLKKQMKNVKVDLIGSSKSGFGMKDSDVDTCLTIEGKSAERVDAKRMVRKIKSILRTNKNFSDVMFISASKIPIVKFIDRRTKLRCDISIYNELAVYNTRLLKAYSRIDQRVKILGCAMKNFAKNACINDTHQRSLSSYSYVLMVLYFLQQVEPPVIPVLQELYDSNGPKPENIVENENAWFFEDIENLDSVWDGSGKNTQSVGELWVGLLEFYTTKFDFHHCINISQKSVVTELKNGASAMLFNIQDPFIKDLNLGSRMSRDMSRRTLKALQRARILFGTPFPIDKPPSGFDTFQDYFFCTENLTEGRVTGNIECSLCGKYGHTDEKCKRHKLNLNRPWNKPPHFQKHT